MAETIAPRRPRVRARRGQTKKRATRGGDRAETAFRDRRARLFARKTHHPSRLAGFRRVRFEMRRPRADCLPVRCWHAKNRIRAGVRARAIARSARDRAPRAEIVGRRTRSSRNSRSASSASGLRGAATLLISAGLLLLNPSRNPLVVFIFPRHRGTAGAARVKRESAWVKRVSAYA